MINNQIRVCRNRSVILLSKMAMIIFGKTTANTEGISVKKKMTQGADYSGKEVDENN